MTQRNRVVSGRLLLALCLAAPSAGAADYYVDPEAGSDDGSGAPDEPFRSIEAVVQSGWFEDVVQPGDRIVLRSGYHGELVLDDGTFDPPVTIEADEGATPRVRRLRVAASGVVLRGLSISPSYAPAYETVDMIQVLESASFVTIEQCEVFSEDDVSAWSAEDWISRASSGAQLSGADITLRGNSFRNVRFGISADGARAHVVRNTVDGFSADGLRGLGDYQVFEYNVVKNVYVDGDLDENHDDGFQSWSVGPDGVGTGEVVGMVLRGNVILNYEDPAQPFRATLQGIGCFDGTFVDWVIENNVVITDHWHGITLLGARNSRIVNNTVIDVNDETPGPPWISIDAHKDGTAPEGCLVRNNLATDYVNADTVLEDHNFVVEDVFALFVDPENHDLHLLPGAEVIDQGSPEQAPARDADEIERPQGAQVDLGAFEWHEADVMAAAPGVSPSAAGGGPNAPSPEAGPTRPTAEERRDAGSGLTANDVDGGCDCRLGSRQSAPGAWWLVVLAALAALARRVREVRRARATYGPTPVVYDAGEVVR